MIGLKTLAMAASDDDPDKGAGGPPAAECGRRLVAWLKAGRASK
jgi:hypothetical protein